MTNTARPRLSLSGILPIVMLLAMLTLGGGSAAGPLTQLLAQLAGFCLLFSALAFTRWRQLFLADPFASGLAVALVLLVVGQLVPLSGQIWIELPGRSLYHAGDILMFGKPLPRPLSLDPDETLAGLVLLAPAFAVWLHARRDLALVERFSMVYLVFLAASLVLAFAQLAAGPGQLRFYPTSHDALPTGFFANRNHQSIAMACGIPLAAAIYRARQASGRPLGDRWSFTLAVVACMTGTLLTGSRTGAGLLLPALAGGLAIALGGDADHSSADHRVNRWLRGLVAALAIIVPMAAGIAASVWKPGGALAIVFSRSLGADDTRYAIWPVVVNMIRETWPWGIGFGSFRYAFEAASTPAVLRPLYINHAHNDWLEFLLEGGLPGLAVAMAFFGWFLRRWLQAWRTRGGAPFGVAGGVVILLLFAHSALDYPMRTITLAACFALCAAALSPPAQPAPSARRSLAGRFGPFVTGLIVVALGGVALNGALRSAALRSDNAGVASALLAPGARLLSLRALKLAQDGASFGVVADAAARAAAISPLTEPAFTAAGLASQDSEQSAALLEHAWQLSRRDPVLLVAQLRRASAAGQPVRAFDAIDALYRLQQAGPAIDQEFAGRLAQPAFLEEATRRLSTGIMWRGEFLTQAFANPTNRSALLALVGRLQRSPRPVGRAELAGAIGTLSFGAASDPWLSFSLYRLLRPGSDSLAWQLPAEAQPVLPFDWMLADTARIMHAERGPRLEFDGDAGSAPLATVRQPLAAGRYRLALVASAPGAALIVGCGADRQRLVDGDLLDWPKPCPQASFALFGAGINGWIDAVRLVPVG